MDEKRDKLQILKDRFDNEGVRSDQAEAARMAGLSSPVVTTGLEKEKWSDLTKGERKCLLALFKILDKRKREEEVIEQQ